MKHAIDDLDVQEKGRELADYLCMVTSCLLECMFECVYIFKQFHNFYVGDLKLWMNSKH